MPDLNELVDRMSSLTVIEACELVKELEQKWGVSASAPVQQAGPAPQEPVVEQQSEFDAILTGFGAKKVEVVKELRSILPAVPLKEAMALVNEIPKPIKTGISKTEAEEIKAAIEKAGGTVEIR